MDCWSRLEGIQYRILWLPETEHMLPGTLEKIDSLVHAGATIVGNAPKALATLSDAVNNEARFNKAVTNIWGDKKDGMRKVGKGIVISNMSLFDAIKQLQLQPDVVGGDALWTHRKIDGADWYFIASPKGKAFNGTLDFRNTGSIELWDPVNGNIKEDCW